MKRVLWPVFLVTMLLAFSVPVAAPAFAWSGMSTRVTISASANEVAAGDTVVLTITETNDSADWRTRPLEKFFDAWVELAPLGLRLDQNSPGFTSSVNTDNVLERLEVWQWQVAVPVSATTTFTASGYGWTYDYDANPPTWKLLTPDIDLDERASVTVTVTPPPPPPPPPPGNEGFTPGFWKNHLDAWAATGYATTDSFNVVFGAGPNITLLDAVNARGGGANALMRAATAALLNAAHHNVNYPLTTAQIMALVQQAFATGDYSAAGTLDGYNNLGGDINS